MAMPSNRGQIEDHSQQNCSVFSRAEALTVLGMLLCMVSLFLVWPVRMDGALAISALAVNLTRTGAPDEVRWPVTGGAILAGLLLAFVKSSMSRATLAMVQALCGVVCFVTAITHFSMLGGPLVALIGGALITVGAVDRLKPEAVGAG